MVAVQAGGSNPVVTPRVLRDYSELVLFRSGTGGYHTYRIPALIIAPGGVLLAFCEARRNSADDSGDIDVVVRRSTDGGLTFSPAETLVDHAADTIGNPAPVVDLERGVIHLLLTGNPGTTSEDEIIATGARGTRLVYAMSSADGGVTWTEPRYISPQVKLPGWTWYATGPGSGIQLPSGRLIVPCDHVEGNTGIFRSHVIYSDDHGETWHIGGSPGPHTDECTVAAVDAETLLLNMRSNKGRAMRAISRSGDGGLTWSEPALEPQLPDPGCQGSMICIERDGRRVLVFTNPHSTQRERLTISTSADGGHTWGEHALVCAGPSAYSALAELPDGSVALAYERGERSPYDEIAFTRLNLSNVSR